MLAGCACVDVSTSCNIQIYIMKYIFIASHSEDAPGLTYDFTPSHTGAGIMRTRNKEGKQVSVPISFDYSEVEFDEWNERDTDSNSMFDGKWFLVDNPSKFESGHILVLDQFKQGNWFKAHSNDYIPVLEDNKIVDSTLRGYLADRVFITQQTWRR